MKNKQKGYMLIMTMVLCLVMTITVSVTFSVVYRYLARSQRQLGELPQASTTEITEVDSENVDN